MSVSEEEQCVSEVGNTACNRFSIAGFYFTSSSSKSALSMPADKCVWQGLWQGSGTPCRDHAGARQEPGRSQARLVHRHGSCRSRCTGRSQAGVTAQAGVRQESLHRQESGRIGACNPTVLFPRRKTGGDRGGGGVILLLP